MAERDEKTVEPVSKQDTHSPETEDKSEERREKPNETEPLFKDWALI